MACGVAVGRFLVEQVGERVEGGRCGFAARGQFGVQLAEPVEVEGLAVAVEGDVVEADVEAVVVRGEFEEDVGVERVAGAQVHAGGHVVVDPRGRGGGRVGGAAHGHGAQRLLGGGGDDLPEVVAVRGEPGAQRLRLGERAAHGQP